MQPRYRAFLAAFVPLVVADRVTKWLAVAHLTPWIPQNVLGATMRFTLVFNRGAAMNLSLGPWSRWGFAAIAVAGVIVMLRLLRLSAPTDSLRATALGLVSAGAIGNLIDRLLSARGVVDFVDVGIGTHRFWTFNVADVGVTMGGLLLALVLLRDGRAPVA